MEQEDIAMKSFIACPDCGKKTRVKYQIDTEMRNYILFCHWCKREITIDFSHGKIQKVLDIIKTV